MESSPEITASEAEQVRRARQGDSAAWEELMRAHQEPVYRYAYLILGDAAEAEDTAQEAMLRAYHALNRFDRQRPLRPWLLSIAGNLARNHRRSMGRYWKAIQRFARETPGLDHDIEARLDQRQAARELWRAVQKLDPTGQQVIYLRFFLELSVEETAGAMGTAAGTVKSRLHRALGRLQSVIRQDFPDLAERFDYD